MYKYNPFTGRLDDIGTPGGGGTVTSVGGGVGITGTPEPIVGAGVLDLDILSLTYEPAIDVADSLAFHDASVGATPSAIRRLEFGDLNAAIDLSVALGQIKWDTQIDFSTSDLSDLVLKSHSVLDDLTADDHPGHPWLAGRSTGQIQHGGTGTGENYVVRSNTAQDGLIILGDDVTLDEHVVIHGDTASIVIGAATFQSHLAVHDEGTLGHANTSWHKYSDIGTIAPGQITSRARGSYATPTVVADGDILYRNVIAGFDGTDYEFAAQIRAEVDDPTPSGTSMGAALVLSTTPRGSVVPVDRMQIHQDGLFEWLNTPSPASVSTVTAMTWRPAMALPATLARIDGLILAPTVTCEDNLASMTYLGVEGTHVQTTIAPSNFMILAALASSITSTSNEDGVFPWVSDLFVDLGNARLIGDGTSGGFTGTTPANYIAVGYLASPTLRATEGGHWLFTGVNSGMALMHCGGTLAATGVTGSLLDIAYRAGVHDVGPVVTVNNSGVVNLDISTTIYTRNYTRSATGLIASVVSELAAAANKWFLYGAGTADSATLGRWGIGLATAPVTHVDINGDLATRAANVAVANGTNNDVAIGARSLVRLTGPTAAFTTTSFGSPQDGKILRVVNTTTQQWTIVNAAGTGTAANRILTGTGADIVLASGGAVGTRATFQYDATLQRWLLLTARDSAGPR